MSISLKEIIDKKGIVILDGAMATELEGKGCDLNNELWSASILREQPELIEQVHYEYFKAGADCSITSSYQASIDGFSKAGYSLAEAEALIIESVKIAKRARERFLKENQELSRLTPLIAGSAGPYGAYLADGSEYTGAYQVTEAELYQFHYQRIKLLKEAGADILAIETVPMLNEAKVTVQIAEELKMPCWVSFSCKNGNQISDGTQIGLCGSYLGSKEIVQAVGINCTAPQYVAELIQNLKAGVEGEKPIIVYPNSGEEYDPASKTWKGSKDGKSYCDWAREWYQAGAEIIGGCCRTKPSDIREIYESSFYQ